MTMVLADPDPDWLAERSSRGIDRWDEVWDGVLHVPPTPSTFHQFFERDLEVLTLHAIGNHGCLSVRLSHSVPQQKGYRS